MAYSSFTQYNEDDAHVSGDKGNQVLGVRNDTRGTLAGTNGDYAPIQFNANGDARVEAWHTDTAPATQNITAADVGSSTGSGANSQAIITGTATANSTASFTLTGQTSAVIQVTGTWVATLQVEISMDGGTTWMTRGVHQAGTSYTAVSFTGNFAGATSVSGYTNIRVRATAYTSGTATVRVTETLNTNSVYVANSIKISDPTTPSQQMAVDSSGRLTVNLATGTNTIGNVNSVAAATGGYTAGKLISAASTNATNIKASAGTLGYITASNVNAAPRYLKIYNKASAPTVGTDTPVHTFIIPGNTAGAGTNIPLPDEGIALGTGIGFAITTGVADADTAAVAANEIVINYGWI